MAGRRSKTKEAGNDARNVRLFGALLGVDQCTVIEDIEFEEAEEFKESDDAGDTLVVARVRPRSSLSRRCGLCGRRGPWYDRGERRRRWRGLDWGTVQVVAEGRSLRRAGRRGGPVVVGPGAPRVNCPTHGPTVVAVGWARHRAGHTLAFDATVAWPAVACSKTAVCELMRIARRRACHEFCVSPRWDYYEKFSKTMEVVLGTI